MKRIFQFRCLEGKLWTNKNTCIANILALYCMDKKILMFEMYEYNLQKQRSYQILFKIIKIWFSAVQNWKEFFNSDVWKGSYEQKKNNCIANILALYCMAEKFLMLEMYEYNLQKQRSILKSKEGMSSILLNMRVRHGVTFSRVRQSPAKSGKKKFTIKWWKYCSKII